MMKLEFSAMAWESAPNEGRWPPGKMYFWIQSTLVR